MRRARRNAGFSQRELAQAIGVGKSTIAQAERDEGSVSLPVLLAALSAGGIELIAVDRDGEVESMRLDALRDRRGRKLPAHLHAWVPSDLAYVPVHWRSSRRRNAPVRWALRGRDSWASWGIRGPDGQLRPLPLQHPGPEDVEIVRERDANEREFRSIRTLARMQRAAWTPPSPDDCTCSDECIELGMTCPPSCPCQCEGTNQDADWPNSPPTPGSITDPPDQNVAPPASAPTTPGTTAAETGFSGTGGDAASSTPRTPS